MCWSLLKSTMSLERIQYTVLLTFVLQHQYLKLHTSHVWMFTPLVNSITLSASVDFKRRQMIPGLTQMELCPQQDRLGSRGVFARLSPNHRILCSMEDGQAGDLLPQFRKRRLTDCPRGRYFIIVLESKQNLLQRDKLFLYSWKSSGEEQVREMI